MAEKDSNSAPPPAPRFSDPFSALRAEMDRMFDNFSFGRFPGLPGVTAPSASNGGAMAPSVDVHESDKKFEQSQEKENYHMMERRYGSFMRSMRLPDTADEESISAKIDKGVRTVTVAKKPGTQTKERTIEIAAS